ncbi:MAG: 5-(carboxyamino)imidazole ribonucleotide mutase [Planctomycetota bacterium]|jgi:5-(carboxyamino)imidazole ribonucleotide mutase
MTRIAIVMGSRSDWPTLCHAGTVLDELQLPYHAEVVSAHRTPARMAEFANQAEDNGFDVIIAGAGGAAHLPGMLAAQTLVPVIGVPIAITALNGVDAMLSILQMPGGVPVATMAIGKPGAINAALYAAAMLARHDPELRERLNQRRQAAAAAVLANPDPRQS